MSSEGDGALVYAVADVGPDREDPRECFQRVRDELRKADVVFGQLEVNLSTRGTRLPQARHTTRSDERTAEALRDAGFTVISFAGNHCMDWGKDGFFDTIENLKAAGLDVVGVGANLTEARAAVVEEAHGVKVAFLAYNSILPAEYWATANRPGCAPARAWTIYEQIELDQPGTPCRIHTHMNREDLRGIVEDIERAKRSADVVVVSLHWGIHFVPAVLAEYQRELARAVIDAGADVILGHHAHILKGIEVYKGKAIFYSMGNFAIDLKMTPEHAAAKSFKEIQALNPDWVVDFDSLYNFPPDSRMTLMVRFVATKDGVREVGFVPAMINRNAEPQLMRAEDAGFSKVVDYVGWASREAGLNVSLRVDGDVVLVEAGV